MSALLLLPLLYCLAITSTPICVSRSARRGAVKRGTVSCAANHYSTYTAAAWNYNYNNYYDSTTSKCYASESSATQVACTAKDRCGPDCWKKISSASNKCGGNSQAPINIVQAELDIDIEPPVLESSGCKKWAQFANDHAFEVSFYESGKFLCDATYLEYGGIRYFLHQFHFHSPSEHSIAGGLADAEVHLVHKTADLSSALVLAVRLQASYQGSNKFLSNFWDAADLSDSSRRYYGVWEKGDVCTTASAGVTKSDVCGAGVSLSGNYRYSKYYEITDWDKGLEPYVVLPSSKASFYTYTGSLTTYPCTEGVTFIVYDEPVAIGYKDLSILKSAVANEPNSITFDASISGADLDYQNNRPIQELNDRTVYKYDPALAELQSASNGRY